MNKTSKILVVDDEPANVRLLERILKSASYPNVESTTDSRQVRGIFERFAPDLILTDLLMPHVDGLEILKELRSLPGQSHLPIVVLTADITSESKRRALSAGATDFITKPFDHSEVVLRVANLLQTRFLHLELERQNSNLEETVRDRTSELEEALRQLKATQDQMIQQERLRALGMMAGGIAHDFNNSLAAMLGYSELALEEIERVSHDAKLVDYLKIVVTAGNDATKMIARLRDFSRPRRDKEVRESIDLNALVKQTISMTVPRWKAEASAKGATISVNLDAGDVPRINGNPAELREALTNLIFNAVDALPKGGSIILRTRPSGTNVELSVQDSGIGMTEEIKKRCLEPFFSTKGMHGTGLGLPMVYGIIQRHEGTVEIKSELGKGTTFQILLPVGIAEDEGLSNISSSSSRPLHILVVDDQAILCELLEAQLSKDFHTVETASNGCEALEKFRHGTFDLVLTDKAMPEMDGDRLATLIKELKPTQPVILLTGFGEFAYPNGDRPSAIDLVLSKPVDAKTLNHALATIARARN